MAPRPDRGSKRPDKRSKRKAVSMAIKECGQKIENPDQFLDQLCPETWSRHVYSLEFPRSLNKKGRADEINTGVCNLFQRVMGVRNTEIFGCFFYEVWSPMCVLALTAARVLHSHRGLEAAGLGSSGLDCRLHHSHSSTDSLMRIFLLRKCWVLWCIYFSR